MNVRNKAQSLFKRVNTFVISCVDIDGYPITKAVVPGRQRDSIDEIYFCTNTSSKFAKAVGKNPKTSVYFYSRKLIWKGCRLQDDMEIIADPKVREKYWQKKFKNAYSEKT